MKYGEGKHFVDVSLRDFQMSIKVIIALYFDRRKGNALIESRCAELVDIYYILQLVAIFHKNIGPPTISTNFHKLHSASLLLHHSSHCLVGRVLYVE